MSSQESDRVGVEAICFVHVCGSCSRLVIVVVVIVVVVVNGEEVVVVVMKWRMTSQCPSFDARMHEVGAPRRGMARHEKADCHDCGSGGEEGLRGWLGEEVVFCVLVAEVVEDCEGPGLVQGCRECCQENVGG